MKFDHWSEFGRGPLDRRIGIAEVEKAYPAPDARQQADRCLKCHVGPVFNGDECILCGGCADVCPEYCLRLVDVAQLRGDETLQAAFLARYGHTSAQCPTGAITMERVELVPA